MSSFSSDDYREAQAAKSFYSDAVASVMNGDVNELTRIIHAFTARNPDVSMQEIMTHFHSEGKTILHLAAGSGHYSVFERLIHMCSDPKAIVNMADKAGFTPLINATIAESLPIMKHLIDLGADVNARNADGASAIHFAASDGSLERLELLTKHGADLSCMSKAGTPLHWACGKSRANAVSFLISQEVDVNARSGDGLPAVFLCAADGSDDCTSMLVRSGAELGLVVSGGLTLLHMCAENGLQLAVKLILEAPSNSGRDSARFETVDGNLPIHLAAMGGHRLIIELLLLFTPISAFPKASNGVDYACLAPLPRDVNPNDLFNMNLLVPSEGTENLITAFIEDGKVRLAAWEAKYMTHNNESSSTIRASSGSEKVAGANEPHAHVADPLLASMAPVSDPATIEKADSLKVAGNAHHVNGEYDKAIECYTQALQLTPDNAVLWSNRSASKLATGDKHGALHDAEVCRRLRPEWTKGCYRLAQARLALGLFEDAAVAAYEGCRLEQNNAELKSILQEAVRLGRLEYEKQNPKTK